MSISFTIRFGDLGFFFGGDAENMAIREIDPDRLEDLCFVKIPHHGSDTSDILPTKINSHQNEDEPFMISVTTGYHKGNSDLPLTNVLDLYKDKSFIILKTEDNNQQWYYGVWSCEFNRTSSQPWSFSSEGDVSVYYKFNS